MNKALHLIDTLSRGGFTAIARNVRQCAREGSLENAIPGFQRLDTCMQPVPNSPTRRVSVLTHVSRVFGNAAQQQMIGQGEQHVLLVAALALHSKKPEVRQEHDGNIVFPEFDLCAAEACEEVIGPNFGFHDWQIEALTWVVRELQHAHQQFADVPSWLRLIDFYRNKQFPILSGLQQADARASWSDRRGKQHLPVHVGAFQAEIEQLKKRDAEVRPYDALSDILGESGAIVVNGLNPDEVRRTYVEHTEFYALDSPAMVAKWFRHHYRI